jgi:hypothetical protein
MCNEAGHAEWPLDQPVAGGKAGEKGTETKDKNEHLKR